MKLNNLETDDFKNAIKGDYPRTSYYCQACNQSFTETFVYCPKCGTKRQG